MKKQVAPVFKEYNMDERLLFPPSLDELIPENHIVRVVNSYIDEMDLSEIEKLYKGGGTSSYHYRMLLKVLVYAYTEKIYSCRKIAKSLRENINFMWIAAGNKPDFRTINRFRLKLKKNIGDIFYSIIEMLYMQGYINLENYFVDGTKVEANANKYKVVWRKNVERNKKRLEEKVKELLKHIDEENEREDKEYGDKDLPEVERQISIDKELLKKKAKEVSEKLKEEPADRKNKSILKKIEREYLPQMEKYEEQEKVLNGRNSYSKTDPDATFMRIKDEGMWNRQLKASYNVQIGTEHQFIIGYSIHQNPNDTLTFIPHMKQALKYLPKKPDNVVADAGYGSEENYNFVKKEKLGNYIKYNQFYIEKTIKFKKDIFRKENLIYNPERDEYLCPNGNILKFKETNTRTSENGYISQIRIYESKDCSNCPLKGRCYKGRDNRKIEVNETLNKFREEARKNLESEKGIKLRKLRNIEPETCFGDIKWNGGFHRFMLRSLEKVKIEWGLLSIAHNLRKVFELNQQKLRAFNKFSLLPA